MNSQSRRFSLPLDYTYRLRLPQRPGQFAEVAGIITEGKGRIGDVVTINLGRDASMRGVYTLGVART